MAFEAKEIDKTKLRYVLYARRSTTDEDSQVRSLPDQITHCKIYKERYKLNVVKIVEESESAKVANKRDEFDDILKNLGVKYDAILSYAPDRLARNMLEGGMIINLLDEGILKDLQFPTHHFTNDPSGKLTLGIMFSISKHFSDDLSRKVSRGIEGNFEDGKSAGSPKWGYDRSDEDGLYRPNDFFSLIQEVWNRRGEGETNKSITEYLLENDYHRMTKISRKNKHSRKIVPSEKSVGNMFEDPFYYGILEQTEQTIDLREVYNFEPMIDEELYYKVQALAYSRKRDTKPKKMLEFKPLAHMVFCGVCRDTRWMLVGKNKPGGSKHHVLSYRCENADCTRSIKSIRAFYIFDAIYELLDKFELTDEAYERYSDRIDYYTDDKIVAIKKKVASKRGAMAHKRKELDDLSLGLGKIDKKSPAYDITDKRINELAIELSSLESEVTELEEKVISPTKIKLTKDQFLNLVKSAPDKMRAGSAVEKDRIARILFLNLHVDNEKRLIPIWKEPFASLVKAIEISPGADERT